MTSQFPVARVKRIVKTDPEIKLIRSDAVQCIAKATEMFLEFLVEESFRSSKSDTRLKYEDMASLVHGMDALEFLTEVLPKTYNEVHFQKLTNKKRVKLNLSDHPSTTEPTSTRPQIIEGENSISVEKEAENRSETQGEKMDSPDDVSVGDSENKEDKKA